MMKWLAIFFVLTSPALAQQPVVQTGSVTPGHVVKWVTNGVIGDAGTAASNTVTSFGTTGQGPTICANSAPITSPFNRLCLAANTASAAQISLQNYGGAAPQALQFNINGTLYPSPFLSATSPVYQIFLTPGAVNTLTLTNLPLPSSSSLASITFDGVYQPRDTWLLNTSTGVITFNTTIPISVNIVEVDWYAPPYAIAGVGAIVVGSSVLTGNVQLQGAGTVSLSAVGSTITINSPAPTTLHPFPAAYTYVNVGLAASPNQLIDFLVCGIGSSGCTGTDTIIYGPTTGLTPATALATAQGCHNYIMANYYYNQVEPICRYIAGAYNGSIQTTGGITGAQLDGGGQLIDWGTCPIPNSPNNGFVNYSTGPADVVLQNIGGTLFSNINGSYSYVACVKTRASVYHFYAQQQSNIFVASSVIVGESTDDSVGVFAADNQGQIYVGAPIEILGGYVYLGITTRQSELVFLTAPSAQFTATGSGSAINVTSISNCPASQSIHVGDYIYALASPNEIPTGTTITSFGTGTGCAGTYNTSVAVSFNSATIFSNTGSQSPVWFSATPTFTDTFYVADNGLVSLATAGSIGGWEAPITSGAKCAINFESTLDANGTSGDIPGGGACGASNNSSAN